MLPGMATICLYALFRIIGIIIMATVSAPFTLVISILVLYFMNKLRLKAVNGLNESQRFESMTKSPLNE
jgi:hypothetical protein